MTAWSVFCDRVALTAKKKKAVIPRIIEASFQKLANGLLGRKGYFNCIFNMYIHGCIV